MKVIGGWKQAQGCLNSRFELQLEISHTRIEGIPEDFAKTGEFGGEGGSRTGLFQAQKFVLELDAMLSVLVEDSEPFKESIIVSEQWGI